MHAIMRRYEGVDAARTDELTRKVNEDLTPRLRELSGFNGYFLFESDAGSIMSLGLFDTAAQADESNRVAADWIREEKLESALPNAPKVTAGTVLAHAMSHTAVVA
jgi:hypothetical protein